MPQDMLVHELMLLSENPEMQTIKNIFHSFSKLLPRCQAMSHHLRKISAMPFISLESLIWHLYPGLSEKQQRILIVLIPVQSDLVCIHFYERKQHL